MDRSTLQAVYDYHQASKHRPERYAPGPGGLDWATQPDPFRTFAGADTLPLPFTADRFDQTFAAVRQGQRPPPAPLDLDGLAALLELSFGLSAWKALGGSRWALRCNPSSGNLHPTECYLVTAPVPGLGAGVYHYLSRDHCLERRARPLGSDWDRRLSGGVVLGLSGIHWREAWKYGLRAFRYCQHDAGHAIGAIAYAAATLGWRAAVLPWGDAELSALLGIDRAADFLAEEREAPEYALWVGPAAVPDLPPAGLLTTALEVAGTANRLSRGHRHWPGIDAVNAACVRPAHNRWGQVLGSDLPPLLPQTGHTSASALIRQRRSAVDFDGVTTLPADRWLDLLDALLPRPDVPPQDAWGQTPRVHLVLFVHRVQGIDPGLYLLARSRAAVPELRASLRPDLRWETVPGAPEHLPLYCLQKGDAREAARLIACHQDIAADSCFAVGMLAGLDAALATGPWGYRDLYGECGLLGQILYLEAEAAGLRGTGIGCFFDDLMHDLLGIADTRWQSLYHFTVGGPVEDPRLQSHPPYAHLSRWPPRSS